MNNTKHLNMENRQTLEYLNKVYTGRLGWGVQLYGKWFEKKIGNNENDLLNTVNEWIEDKLEEHHNLLRTVKQDYELEHDLLKVIERDMIKVINEYKSLDPYPMIDELNNQIKFHNRLYNRLETKRRISNING